METLRIWFQLLKCEIYNVYVTLSATHNLIWSNMRSQIDTFTLHTALSPL